MSGEVPQHGEVWADADGTLYTRDGGGWFAFGCYERLPDDLATITRPMRRVFTVEGGYVLDSPLYPSGSNLRS